MARSSRRAHWRPALGNYRPNKDITVRKTEIAKVQLEDAIQLFLCGRCLSALTLAGAADGIFSEYLGSRGLQSIAEETWAGIVAVREKTGLAFAGNRTKKEAFNKWNMDKNRVKHHNKDDEEFVTINYFDAAYEMIQRANADGEKICLLAENRQEYETWVIENICT